MGQITIRKLDDAVIQALKQRAAAAGHSMEEEARQTLMRSATPGVDRLALVKRMEAFAAKLDAKTGPSIADLIREMRDERTEQLASLRPRK